MATRYWVGGTGTWDNSATTHWSASSGGASGASAPISTDDVIFDTSSGGGTITISSTATCNNLTINGTTSTNNIFSLGANFAPGGTVSLNGNSFINRIFIKSSVVGAVKTLTINGALTASYVDFQDITAAGTASWNLSGITGGSGNCGNNTGITFTTSATQTWSGGSANWSTATWTSRIPLPQDDVIISLSGTVGITVDMPRMCANLDMSGCTGAVTLLTASNYAIYGSYKLSSTCIISGGGNGTLNGYGVHTIDQAGKSIGVIVVQPLAGGSYSLSSNLLSSSTVTISGNFAANNFNITGTTINTSGVSSTSTFGTSIMTCSSTAGGTVFAGGGGGSTTYSTATIIMSGVSATSRTFAGAGKTYGTLTYTVAGSTGALVITGANTFGTINFSDITNARTLTLPASTTTTITTLNVNGTSGKLMTINSSSGGTAATLSKSSGLVSLDYLSIQDSTATGGAAWYAGANSTSVSGNTGWIFTAPISLADTSTGSDSQSITAATSLTDTGTGAETLDAAISFSVSDSGTGIEDSVLSVDLSLTDSFTDSESTLVEVPISVSDSGSGSDAASVEYLNNFYSPVKTYMRTFNG